MNFITYKNLIDKYNRNIDNAIQEELRPYCYKHKITYLQYQILAVLFEEGALTIGDLSEGGKLKYKKTSTKYWETSTNLEMVVDELTQYNIQYEDMNKNKIEKIISLEMDSNNNLVVTEI